ncbi:chromosome partitioning protein, ParB family [Pseudorhodobacter antarcticus]|uniref:Chromosome partitioning protein, ParB family n=2 Tax=Pseudorhodobacter antarcticus TaxID=1077947 RepID=A0A1H8CCF1_9RHOB|nr:ParB N-terminal domain-containing protein [Pseudorhodobacter antarcticus]SEM92680.1 chromosome partitioning protein, ParB family [Pseudorhodobacter antarcticus]
MLHRLLIDQIDTNALPRDRTHLDAAALNELQTSIAQNGLRMPIEVFATTGPRPYALISGLRRLTAVTNIAQLRGQPAEIDAFIRTPKTLAEALTAMVEENDIRQNLSPWERAHIITTLRDNGEFETLDAATQALYPHADKSRRQRLRACALVVEDLDGLLTTPEAWSERQLLRLAAALRADFTPLIIATLQANTGKSPAAQWHALQPIFLELAQPETNQSTPQPDTPQPPGRPRRTLAPRQGLLIRRERTPTGWLLRFTGPEATGMLMEDVMDEVERRFG